MSKLRRYLNISFAIVVATRLDAYCQVNILTINDTAFHIDGQSVHLLFTAAVLGAVVGALSPSAIIAYIAGTVPVALAIAATTYLTNFDWFDSHSLLWRGIPLLVSGLGGLLGYFLMPSISLWWRRRFRGQYEGTEMAPQRTGAKGPIPSRLLLPIYALIILGIVFFYWQQAKAKAAKMEEFSRRLNKDSLKDRLYVLSHPEEFPNLQEKTLPKFSGNSQQPQGQPDERDRKANNTKSSR
jgi:hypothetical protein